MDVVLRARHDLLMEEFRCTATELRLLRTPPGSNWTRSIDPFCGEPLAPRFGSLLSDFQTCCAACSFLSFRLIPDDDEEEPRAAGLEDVRESA